ncbi:MAG: FAD-binding protein, partial [Pseudomonadota bacterium]
MKLSDLTTRVSDHYGRGQPIAIVGGGTRCFLGNAASASESLHEIDAAGYAGVLDYHPAELTLRAKAGTRISELKDLVAAEGQMLAFDPPAYGDASTLGGVVASGMSGSRRPYAGAVRDFVLGTGLVLHTGEYLEFGGQVMKNVAGYDVSRLVCGSFGIFGVIADVSLKVLPRPETEQSMLLELAQPGAQKLVAEIGARMSCLSASAYFGDALRLRLSGTESAVKADREAIGGDA